MRFVSLFAGIGGMCLGLERAGHECVGQVEIDPWARSVLDKRWPHVHKESDVRNVEGAEFPKYDLLTAGYPCQPFSYAGKQRGERDPRHLWPEAYRIIRNVRPRYVLLENVPGHLALGFGRVLGDLAEIGYDAEWDCIPAAAVGAPHRRDRVFIVAYPNGEPEPVLHCGSRQAGSRAATSTRAVDSLDAYRREVGHRQWGAEPGVGRVVDGVPPAVDRIRGLGNAVVPQVAEWIGLRLPL